MRFEHEQSSTQALRNPVMHMNLAVGQMGGIGLLSHPRSQEACPNHALSPHRQAHQETLLHHLHSQSSTYPQAPGRFLLELEPLSTDQAWTWFEILCGLQYPMKSYFHVPGNHSTQCGSEQELE